MALCELNDVCIVDKDDDLKLVYGEISKDTLTDIFELKCDGRMCNLDHYISGFVTFAVDKDKVGIVKLFPRYKNGLLDGNAVSITNMINSDNKSTIFNFSKSYSDSDPIKQQISF